MLDNGKPQRLRQQQPADFLAGLQHQDLIGQHLMLNNTLTSMQNTGRFLAYQLGVPSSITGLDAMMENNGNLMGPNASYINPLALATNGFIGQSDGFPYLF